MELASDENIAKLVLAYLFDNSCEEVHLRFCKHNQHLQNEYQLLKSGSIPMTVLAAPSLVDMITDYLNVYSTVQGYLDYLSLEQKQKLLTGRKTLDFKLKTILSFLLPKYVTNMQKNRKRKAIKLRCRVSDTENDSSLSPDEDKILEKRLKLDCSGANSTVQNVNETSSNETMASPERSKEDSKQQNQENSKNSLQDVVSGKLLENTNFQNKLATTINKVLESTIQHSETTAATQAEDECIQNQLEDAIRNIINITEKDPIFSEILEDIVDTAEEGRQPNKSIMQPPKDASTPNVKSDAPTLNETNTDKECVAKMDNSKKGPSSKIEENENQDNETNVEKNRRKKTPQKKSPSPEKNIRMSLRPRKPKKVEEEKSKNTSKTKTSKSSQIEILSNETYNGPLPGTSQEQIISLPNLQDNPPILNQSQFVWESNVKYIVLQNTTDQPILLPSDLNNLPIILSDQLNMPVEFVETAPIPQEVVTNPVNEQFQMVPELPSLSSSVMLTEEEPKCVDLKIEPNVDPMAKTPKMNTMAHLMTKASSTPRRSHVRVLTFHTPDKPIPSPIHSYTDSKLNKPTLKTEVIKEGLESSKENKDKKSTVKKKQAFNKSHFTKIIDNTTPKVPKKTKRKRIINKDTIDPKSTQKTEKEPEINSEEDKSPAKEDPYKQWEAIKQTFKSKDWDNNLRQVFRGTFPDQTKKRKIKPKSKNSSFSRAKESRKTPSQKVSTKKTLKRTKSKDEAKVKEKEKEDSSVESEVKNKKESDSKPLKEEVEMKYEVVEETLDNNLLENGKKTSQESNIEVRSDNVEKASENVDKPSENIEPVENCIPPEKSLEDTQNKSKSKSPPEFPKKKMLRRMSKRDVTDEMVEDFQEPLKKPAKSPQKFVTARLEDSFNLLETPMKDLLPSSIPMTPRFLVPGTESTPMPRLGTQPIDSHISAIKVPEIQTPSFAITPGGKLTPDRTDSPKPFPNRPTDYSSSSSYYKPDESEDIEKRIELMLNERTERTRTKSEAETLEVQQTQVNVVKVKTPIKLDNPVVLERVKSFSEQTKISLEENPPHYTFVEAEKLPDSSLSTNDSSSSSSSCDSDCSSCSSTDKSDMVISDEEKDNDWNGEVRRELISETNFMINDEGDMRFPLRNWVTPKKSSPEPNTSKSPEKEPEPPQARITDNLKELEQKRIRTIERFKLDQTKSNAAVKKKFFRIHPGADKVQSPSKRKKATPRKCIEINTQPQRPSRVSKRISYMKTNQEASAVVLNSGNIVRKQESTESIEQISLHVSSANISGCPENGDSETNDLKQLIEKPDHRKIFKEVFGDSTDDETNPTPLKKTLKPRVVTDSIKPKPIEIPEIEKKKPNPQEEKEESEEEDKTDDCELVFITEESSTFHKVYHDPEFVAQQEPLTLDYTKCQTKIYLEDNGFTILGLSKADIYDKEPEKIEDKPKSSTNRGNKKLKATSSTNEATAETQSEPSSSTSSRNRTGSAPANAKPCLPKLGKNTIDDVLNHIHGLAS